MLLCVAAGYFAPACLADRHVLRCCRHYFNHYRRVRPTFIADVVEQIGPWLYGGAAVWLFGYGLLRVRDLFDNKTYKLMTVRLAVFGIALGLQQRFINPHVYLDTVVLIGTISLQFSGK